MIPLEGIVGVLFGFILGSLRRYFGTVTIYPSNYSCTPMGRDSYGARAPVSSLEEAESIQIEFDLGLYNSKEVPIPLHNLKASVRRDDKELFCQKVDDRSTFKVENQIASIEELTQINIQPHSLREASIRFTFNEEEKIEKFKKATEVYFLAEQPRGWSLWDRKIKECVKVLEGE